MVCPTMVQVTNVSPLATTQQMKELFSYLGDIVDIKLYPGDQAYVAGSYKLPIPCVTVLVVWGNSIGSLYCVV